MLITCPKCSTIFNLPDEKARPLRKARCSFCSNIFVLADGMDDEAFGEISINQNPPDSPPNEEAEQDSHLSSILSEGSDYDVDSVKPKKTNKLLPIILGSILLVIIALAAFVYLGRLDTDTSTVLTDPELTDVATEQVSANATSHPTDSMLPPDDSHVKDIIFQDTNQYFVNNEKLGRIFVVEGKVVNNYKTPRELIKIEASLLDEAGTPVATKQQFCGITLTMFQLQVLSQADMDKALSNNIEILANNLNIQPGGAVSFMIVFINPPPSISTLFLKILDAKESPAS